jgi:cell division protease FtsH
MDDKLGLFSTEALHQNIDSQLIDNCRIVMNDLYDKTRQLVRENLNLLEQITQELLEQESLSGEDIQRICA